LGFTEVSDKLMPFWLLWLYSLHLMLFHWQPKSCWWISISILKQECP